VQHGYQKLYFLAREGEIMKKVYDIVSPYIEGAPKSHYLLCSRRAVMVSSLYTLDDIQNYILKTKDIKITLDHIFTKQLGVDSRILTDEICTMYQIRDRYQIINLLSEYKKIADILKHFENEILENAHNEREMYLQYLSQNGLENGVNAKAAVVDIGYGGTMQMLLGKLTNQKIGGLYLFTFDTAKEAIQSGLNCQGFLSNYAPQSWMQSTLKAGYIVSIFENILSNTDGSFVKFTNKMEPVFVYGNSQDKLTKILPDIHKGITDFANEIMRIFGKDALDINVPCQSLEGIINNDFTDPAHMDIMILEGLTLERNVNTLNETKVVPTQEEINQQVRKGVEIATIKKPYKWQESVNIMIARAEFLLNKSETPTKKKTSVNITNNDKIQRKMIKFVQEPEAFWRDVKFKPLKLFKPFFVKKETRQKFANFYMKYKG